MADHDIAAATEAELVELSALLTEPGERECLRCYLLRMICEFGCDGTYRWTERWRDVRAPWARGLVRRLRRLGDYCCDCAVLLNVYPDYPETDRLLPCAGQPNGGSSAPCELRPPRYAA